MAGGSECGLVVGDLRVEGIGFGFEPLDDRSTAR